MSIGDECDIPAETPLRSADNSAFHLANGEHVVGAIEYQFNLNARAFRPISIMVQHYGPHLDQSRIGGQGLVSHFVYIRG